MGFALCTGGKGVASLPCLEFIAQGGGVRNALLLQCLRPQPGSPLGHLHFVVWIPRHALEFRLKILEQLVLVHSRGTLSRESRHSGERAHIVNAGGY